MRNGVDNINLDEKPLAGIKHLSRREIQKIVAEKFEYFSSLIKYSKNSGLTLKPFQANNEEEGTFACGLGDEGNMYFSQYMEGKIQFSDIPEEYFEPKYLYYWLPWLISKKNDVLGPIIDHELEHAESSDYGDILINSREAVLHNLPVTMVGMFFNAFEDIYMGKKQIARGRAKKLGVQNLYKDMFPTTGTIDKRSETLKLDQFAKKALFYRLNEDFPSTFDVNYVVDKDVQEEFNEFINHLNEIVDVTIDNKERVKKKNDILWPIIERLGKKDMDKLKREMIKQQIQQERKDQQSQQVQKTQKNTQEELKDTLNQQQGQNGEQQQGNGSQQQGNSSEQQGNGSQQQGNGSQQQGNGSEQQGNSSEQQGNGSEQQGNGSEQQGNGSEQQGNIKQVQHGTQKKLENALNNEEGSQGRNDSNQEGGENKGDDGNGGEPNMGNYGDNGKNQKSQQVNSQSTQGDASNSAHAPQSSQSGYDQYEESDGSGTNHNQIDEEIQKRLQNMSDEEKKQMIEDIKNKVDSKNLKENGEDLRMQKKLLEKKTDLEDNKDEPLESKDDGLKSKREAKEKERLEKKQKKAMEEMQKQWEKIEKAVEKRQKELGNEQQLGEYLDKLEEMTHEKDFERMDKIQKACDELMRQSENIESDDVKERIKDKIKAMSEYIKQREREYEEEIKKSGFSKEEEYLYKRYMKLEKELKKDVDRFIRKLEDEIPKLKEYHLEGGYTSGRVTDMNEAGRKVRLKQWGEKLYSRLEERESLEVNLGICLSIDVSGSMSYNIGETMKLVIFLGLLCQKWGIPFHVNTFGERLNIIKDTDDDFEKQKGKLMRELIANGGSTNISLSVKKNLNVIKEVKDIHKDTVFLPIFITDGYANEGITGNRLIELMKGFKGLSTIVGIGIDEQYLKKQYPNSKVIGLRNASEIMTVLLRELRQFLKKHKAQIFKVVTE